jgi:putative ABC transport system substrate-binding protein
MRKKADLLTLISVLLFVLVLPSFSEGRMIIALKSANIEPYSEAVAGFQRTCGCELTQISLSETGRDDALDQIEEAEPSAIFAVGLDALNLAAETRGIPVVYSMVPYFPSPDPARRNASGVRMYIPPEKFLSSIIDLFPGVRRIGTIYDERHSDAFIRDAAAFCKDKGIELVAKSSSRPADFPALLDGMKGKVDLFWMVPDATVVNPESVQYLLLFSFRNRVPVFTFTRKYVEMGAAAGLYASPKDIGEQAGEIGRRILGQGGGIHIREDIRKPVLMVNSKIIMKLGIKLRSEVLQKAEDVR